jgi:hypothetical protein
MDELVLLRVGLKAAVEGLKLKLGVINGWFWKLWWGTHDAGSSC